MQQQAPSITDLPADLLRRIFSTLLPSAEPQPLLDVGQQWLSLQLTCKAWAAALQAEPPIPLAVSASLPPPGSVPWLQEHAAVLHLKAVNRLEVASVDDFQGADNDSRMLDWVQRHCGLPHADALWIPNEYTGSQAAYLSCAVRYEDWIVLVLAGLETVPANFFKGLVIRAGAPLLALPECSNLQELHLEAPRMFNPHQPAFDSALLSDLPRLRRLELVGFGPIYLDDLPASLRTLRSLGGQVTEECSEDEVPFFLSFPEHCRSLQARPKPLQHPHPLPTTPQDLEMVGAKKASKLKGEKAKEAKAAVGGEQGGKKGGKAAAGGRAPQKTRARDEIVPWGWEQAAKEERKKKSSERSQAEAAARAARELADMGLANKPVKKQPAAAAAEPAAPAKDAAAPAKDAKKGGKK